MSGTKILVLGGTGPAGICLLRELVYRQHETVAYARNPSKIPEDLASSDLIEVVEGEMDELDSLSTAMAKCRLVISLLGPNIIDRGMSPTLFSGFYKASVFPLMRQLGVRRIFAMGTVSIVRPEDQWTLSRTAMVALVRTFANSAYQNILNIAKVFEHDADGLEWTIFRIGAIPGKSDEDSWRCDREDGEAFVGWVGERGWTYSQRRGALARWLVDAAEGEAEEGPKASSGYPTVAVVIPKMDQSPSMNSSSLNNAGNGAPKESNNTTTNPVPAPEVNVQSPEPVLDPGLLESEMELVSSLAKLQKLEEMIHELRTLLPDRLLEPLAPMVNPKATDGNTIPSSEKLFAQLTQAARAGASEVEQFQSMWRGPEMKRVWQRIDTLIYENAGQLLQPIGMWERDYGSLLEDLTKQDSIRKEQQQKAQEELERTQLQSTEGGWKAVVDKFIERDVPGVRIVPTETDSTFFVLLTKTGLAFKIHTVGTAQDIGSSEWEVSSKSASGEPPSRLESAVLDCLNSRPRKWDLTFLLEMISSYSNIFQTTCIKCGNMQDKGANLPTIRRPKPTNASNEHQPPTFEAYHVTCI
ncbi:hypothetical protein BJX61DRAFT_533711 [Aspergillus egyptiacus]|nr:hypothetical protein BJX61DRAFT_533711 [Aspergillus egyptiacus]